MKYRSSSFTADLVILLTYTALVLLAIVGWVKNIVIIANLDTVTTGMFVLRVVGIFIAPLGSVLGWL